MPDGSSLIFRSYVFGPSGFWTMAPLHCAAKFDPFLSLDCDATLAQSKGRKGSNFAIWQPWDEDEEGDGHGEGGGSHVQHVRRVVTGLCMQEGNKVIQPK